MGLIVSSDKEMRWIEGERRRQAFYGLLIGFTFVLMAYSFFHFVVPENLLAGIYRITFFYAFLAFMLTVQIHHKSQRYLKIIDTLLIERRDDPFLQQAKEGLDQSDSSKDT